jgi:hypothetical protein
MLRRALPAFCVVTWILWPSVASASARVTSWSQQTQGTCGFVGSSGVPTIGTLAPAIEGSVYELQFREGDEPKDLLIKFEVKECLLGPEFAETVPVRYEFATILANDAFGPEIVTATGDRAIWKIPVNSDLFDAGVHKGFVVIGGNKKAVNVVEVPVVLSKSESEWVALFVGGLAWLIGVLFAYFTASPRTLARLVGGIVISAAPVLAIVKAQYWDVPGWSGTEAKFYLFISVLAASFGGVKAGMLGTATSQGGTPPAPETG